MRRIHHTLLRSLLAVVLLLIAYPQRVASQGAPVYADSEKGLKQLIEELQDAAVKGDGARFRASANSLKFEGHEAWFKEVFGERLGGRAAEDYTSRTATLMASLFVAFQKLAEGSPAKLEVEKITDPCDPKALEKEYAVLFAREKKVPLYSVRYKREGKYDSFGYFTYTDKGFRYLGHIDLGSHLGELFQSVPRPGRVLAKANVQAAKLIEKAAPHYPDGARRAGIQGTVRLHVIVGRDGRIHDLQLLSGNCWLAEAAVEAVRKWRYQPTLLEGEPVEVVTTIDVIFTLSR